MRAHSHSVATHASAGSGSFEVTHLDGLHDVRQGRLHGSSPAAGSNGARGVAGAKTALLGGEGLFPHARMRRATLAAPASSGAPRGSEVSLLILWRS